MEIKPRKVHVRWSDSELNLLAEVIIKMMLNGNIDKQFLSYLKKAQHSLPTERRRSILGKTQVPSDLIIIFKKKLEETLPDIKKARNLLQSQVLLDKVSTEDLTAELERRKSLQERAEKVSPPVQEVPVEAVQEARPQQASVSVAPRPRPIPVLEEAPQKKKFKVLVLGVWPKEERRFSALHSPGVQLEFRSPADKPDQIPQGCGLCVALSNMSSKWTSRAKEKYEKCIFVPNLNKALATVKEAIPV